MPKRSSADRIASSCLAMRTRRIDRIITRLYDDALRPYGLKSTQLSLLVAIWVSGGISPADLGRALDMEKSTVSRNVGKLATSGWVRQSPGRLELTPDGRSTVEAAYQGWQKAQRRAQSLIGSELSSALSSLPLPT